MPENEEGDGSDRPDPSSPRATKIFLSYRREDAADAAGRLYDTLTTHFGKSVFMDVDTIEPGLDFVDVINEAVGSCDALIAVIGRTWLNAQDSQGRRRLDNPEDFVRVEVEAAIRRNIRVIPALVQGATMPRSDELPESLATLSRRNAVELDAARWQYDVGRLMSVLDKVIQEQAQREQAAAQEQAAREKAAQAAAQERAAQEAARQEATAQERAAQEAARQEATAQERAAQEAAREQAAAREEAARREAARNKGAGAGAVESGDQPKPRTKRSRKPWLIGVAVLAAIGVIVGLLSALGRGAPSTAGTSAPSSPPLVSSNPSSQAPVIVTFGTSTLQGTYTFDLETGNEGGSQAPPFDIWWEIRDTGPPLQGSMQPLGDALIANLHNVNFASVSFDDLLRQTYSTTSLEDNGLNSQGLEGDVFAVLTREGDYAKVRVVNYGYDLTIQWVTYKG